MSLFSAASLAQSGLNTVTAEILVLSRNISGASDTSVYSEKTANVMTGPGGGSQIASITRATNQAVFQNLLGATSANATQSALLCFRLTSPIARTGRDGGGQHSSRASANAHELAGVGREHVQITWTSPTALSIAVPNGNTVSLNIASMTQLASPFAVSTATMDGNAPSKVQSVSIGTDGTLSYVYANGKTVPAYSIPLGNVVSPDNLTNITGDVFQVNSESGGLVIGTAGTGALGTIQSSELESSTVDQQQLEHNLECEFPLSLAEQLHRCSSVL
jgi:flagellar hook-basal body protein